MKGSVPRRQVWPPPHEYLLKGTNAESLASKEDGWFLTIKCFLHSIYLIHVEDTNNKEV